MVELMTLDLETRFPKELKFLLEHNLLIDDGSFGKIVNIWNLALSVVARITSFGLLEQKLCPKYRNVFKN